MPIEKAWPSLLPDVLVQKGKPVDVINGSISGDTTGNGLARLPQLLDQHKPDSVLIELGANDGLRGFAPPIIKQNLNTIIDTIEAAGATPILMQIHVLPNYGKRYTQAFSGIYPALAADRSVALIPFFLEGIITSNPQWIMDDGLHPKPEAQSWIAEFVADSIVDLL